MLLGVDRAESIKTDPIIGQRQIAILAVGGILALGALIGVAFSGDVTGVPPENAQKSTYEAEQLSTATTSMQMTMFDLTRISKISVEHYSQHDTYLL